MTAVSPAFMAQCISPSYEVSRSRFILAASEAGARLVSHVSSEAQGPDGGSLSTDVAVLGPDDAEKAAVVISGTHGPEGYVGAAAQIAWLRELGARNESLPVKLVLIHALNPWGFAHTSRMTENNVDINRNFIDWTAPPPVNERYAEIHPWICPRDFSDETLAASQARIDEWTAANGASAFVDAMMGGQYTHPEGLTYGGTRREWSNRILERIIVDEGSSARKIALIDWHTGIGELGQPFFLCFNEPGSPGWLRACDWWGRQRIDTRAGFGGAARPDYRGLVFDGIRKFAAHAELTGAVVEFGTLPRMQTRRGLQLDLQIRFNPDLDDQTRARMREEVLNAFLPPSTAWRCSVLGHTIGIQHQMLEGLLRW